MIDQLIPLQLRHGNSIRGKRYGGKTTPKVEGSGQLRCPMCDHTQSQVFDSRGSPMFNRIRRRRECLLCHYRFTTYEVIALEDVIDYQI